MTSQKFMFTAHAAFLMAQAEDFDRAIELYTRAAGFHCNNENRQKVVAELARLHYAKGDMENAVRRCTQSCDLLAQMGGLAREADERELLAYLLTKLGRQNDASVHISRIQKLRGSAAK